MSQSRATKSVKVERADNDNVVLLRHPKARASNKSKAPKTVPLATQSFDTVIGRVARIDSSGDPVVTFEGASGDLHARSLCDLGASAAGVEVALTFERGNLEKPIVIGILSREDRRRQNDFEVLVDGQRVALKAEREIQLCCGKASITLTRAGKIVLRGTHVVSRSSGANKLQGSQVRIN